MYGAFRRSPCHVASHSPVFLSACRSSAPTGESPKFCSLRTPTSRLQLGTNTCPTCSVLRRIAASSRFPVRLKWLSMIAHLRGTLLAKHPNQAVVETGGIGYDVTISVPTFSDLPGLGSNVALHIHTHVREDVIALYGFLRPEEKQLFEKLITVSGIGPKLAITILSGMPTDDMINSIRGNEVARLTKIPGIGKKTAERMVLELRDKLPSTGGTDRVQVVPSLSATQEDVLSALVNLGYQRLAAERALGSVDHNGSFDAMFRAALAVMAK